MEPDDTEPQDLPRATVVKIPPPPPRPPLELPEQLYVTDPSELAAQRNAAGAPRRGRYSPFAGFGVIGVMVWRIVATMNHSSSYSPQIPNIPPIDLSALDHMYVPPDPAIAFPPLPVPVMAPLAVVAGDTREVHVAQIRDSLSVLMRDDIGSPDQIRAAAAFGPLVTAGDCKPMLAALPSLAGPDAPPAPLPTYEATQHIEAVRARVHAMCPAPKPRAHH